MDHRRFAMRARLTGNGLWDNGVGRAESGERQYIAISKRCGIRTYPTSAEIDHEVSTTLVTEQIMNRRTRTDGDDQDSHTGHQGRLRFGPVHRREHTEEDEHGEVGDVGEEQEDEELIRRVAESDQEIQDDVEDGNGDGLEGEIDECQRQDIGRWA